MSVMCSMSDAFPAPSVPTTTMSGESSSDLYKAQQRLGKDQKFMNFFTYSVMDFKQALVLSSTSCWACSIVAKCEVVICTKSIRSLRNELTVLKKLTKKKLKRLYYILFSKNATYGRHPAAGWCPSRMVGIRRHRMCATLCKARRGQCKDLSGFRHRVTRNVIVPNVGLSIVIVKGRSWRWVATKAPLLGCRLRGSLARLFYTRTRRWRSQPFLRVVELSCEGSG